jgi:hypothetical protein
VPIPLILWFFSEEQFAKVARIVPNTHISFAIVSTFSIRKSTLKKKRVK